MRPDGRGDGQLRSGTISGHHEAMNYAAAAVDGKGPVEQQLQYLVQHWGVGLGMGMGDLTGGFGGGRANQKWCCTALSPRSLIRRGCSNINKCYQLILIQ